MMKWLVAVFGVVGSAWACVTGALWHSKMGAADPDFRFVMGLASLWDDEVSRSVQSDLGTIEHFDYAMFSVAALALGGIVAVFLKGRVGALPLLAAPLVMLGFGASQAIVPLRVVSIIVLVVTAPTVMAGLLALATRNQRPGSG